jgi:hypothetical protein
MKLDITQPPFETTLMGVVKAVLDHYDLGVSDATVYGGSGHAFLVNVHEALCPSSPYCWDYDGMYPLLANLGLGMTDLGFFHSGSPARDRAEVEAKLRDHLDAGRPCSLLNMDNQVVYGYDETAFLTARPWPKNPDYPPGTLTFTEWPELGEEVHVNFFVFEKGERADERTIHADSLRYAVGLWREPGRYQGKGYGIGPRAYDHWAAAAGEHGSSHGNWWNGTVWSECRAQAAAYLGEIAAKLEGTAAGVAEDLSARYGEIAAGLGEIAKKEQPADEKAALAREIEEREAAAIAKVEELVGLLAV